MSTIAATTRTARWKRLGGGGIAAAGVILVLAVVASIVFQTGDPQEFLVLLVWAVLLIIASIVLAVGLFAIAGWGPGGIVGGSIVGKIALYVFAVFQVIATAVRVLVALVAADRDQTTVTVPSLPGIVAFVGAIIAAIIIARAGFAKGFARWTLAVWVAFGVIAAVIQAVVLSAAVSTVLEAVSAILLIVVGVSYLRSGTVAGRGAPVV